MPRRVGVRGTIDGTLHEGDGYSLRVTYAGGDF